MAVVVAAAAAAVLMAVPVLSSLGSSLLQQRVDCPVHPLSRHCERQQNLHNAPVLRSRRSVDRPSTKGRLRGVRIGASLQSSGCAGHVQKTSMPLGTDPMVQESQHKQE